MPAVHILYVATLYKWVQGYFLYISTRCIGSLNWEESVVQDISLLYKLVLSVSALSPNIQKELTDFYNFCSLKAREMLRMLSSYCSSSKGKDGQRYKFITIT